MTFSSPPVPAHTSLSETPPRLAKLLAPRADALLPRERLFAQLDALADTPMLWLAAPPGAGKTSLVASWLQARQRPTLWMQIDAADADPASFFHYLGLAARGRCALPQALPLFTPDDALRPIVFARRHGRSLFAQLPAGTALVFDNLQEAGAPLAPLLAVLLEELPPDLQVIALSREDPPPELARARAAHQLALLGWKELRFVHDEAAAVAARCGITSAPIVAQLFSQSQGWAAGIVLMVEGLRQHGALQPATPDAGLDLVFDYFASQVFDAREPTHRGLLLRLSYLPRMTAQMATDMCGSPAAATLLNELSRRHLFTDRRMEPAPTYEFHALFRGFLQTRAQREFGAEADTANMLRAATLLHAAGHDSDAFALYHRSHHFEAASRLALDCASALAAAGRHQTLADWIGTLPQALREADPWHDYWLGMARTGLDPDASRRDLEHALARFEKAGERRGQVLALAALLSRWWNEPDNVRWLEPHVYRLAALLDGDNGLDAHTLASGLVALTLARLMIRPGDAGLTRWVRQLSRLPFDELPPALVLAAGTCLLQFHWGVGDTDACEVAVRRTRPLAERADLPASDRMWFWFWLMTHRVYMADAAGARDAMEQARGLKDDARRAPPFIDFMRWDLTLELQQGHIREARQRLTRDLEPRLREVSRFTQACIELEWVRCANEEGRFAEAIERGQRAMELSRAAGHDWLQLVMGLSVCCAQALLGKLDDGFRTLAQLRLLEPMALPLLAASVEAYDALLHLRSGSSDAARAALDRAMALRGTTAYVWGPGWNRPAIAELAAFAFAEGRHAAAMHGFVRGLRLAAPSADVEHWPWPVRLRVLGGFAVEIDGDAQALRSRKPAHRLLDLLKALAAMGGQDVPATRLCDTVWPDADGDAAMRSLDTSLSRLRKLLGQDDALPLRAGKVSLNSGLVQLDLAVFAQHIQALASVPAGTAAWQQAALQALRGYRGPLLRGEADSSWLLGEREHWRARWLGVVADVAAQLQAGNRPDELQRLFDDAQGTDACDGLARLRRRYGV